MSEWLKEHAWKACVGETLPWVRIPLSPNPFAALGLRLEWASRASSNALRALLFGSNPTLSDPSSLVCCQQHAGPGDSHFRTSCVITRVRVLGAAFAVCVCARRTVLHDHHRAGVQAKSHAFHRTRRSREHSQ